MVRLLALTVNLVIPVVFGKLSLAESMRTKSFCPTAAITCLAMAFRAIELRRLWIVAFVLVVMCVCQLISFMYDSATVQSL